jgi:hypothetical protein
MLEVKMLGVAKPHHAVPFPDIVRVEKGQGRSGRAGWKL